MTPLIKVVNYAINLTSLSQQKLKLDSGFLFAAGRDIVDKIAAVRDKRDRQYL